MLDASLRESYDPLDDVVSSSNIYATKDLMLSVQLIREFPSLTSSAKKTSKD